MSSVAEMMQQLTVEDGAELAYADGGGGEPLLLAHAGVFSSWFAPLGASPLLQGFRVIRMRRAGYGGQPLRPPRRYLTIADHAQHCAALIAHLGLGSVHYVGHSSSCLIGLQLALDHPELVRSLTLLEPAPGGRLHGPADKDFAQRVVGPAMAAFSAGDGETAFTIFMRGVGGVDERKIVEERLGIEGYQQAVRESAYFFAEELRAVQEWRFGEVEAGRIHQPTLVVEGSESRRIEPLFHEVVEILIGLLPAAQITVVEGVNHLMPLQAPDAIGRVLATHVHRHPAAARRASTPAESAEQA